MPANGDDEDLEAQDYQIGYCKPPVATRFPNQRNMNRRGRRFGVKSRNTIVRRVANERVTVTVSGKKRRLTQLELIVLTVRNEAAKGNRKATRLARKLLGILPLDEPQVPKAVLIVPEKLTEEEWLERFPPPD